MKKILLSAITIATSLTAFSQVNGRIAKSNKTLSAPEFTQKLSATVLCDTIGTLTTTSLTVGAASSDTATPGCSPNAGYVYGTNCYGDLEKANFFSAASYTPVISGATVSGVLVAFYNFGTEGTGGVATHTVGMKLYSGTNVTTAPGSVLGSTVATLGAITAAHTTTNSLFFYTFDFAAPVAVPATGGFYTSLVLPNTPGDTAVVVNQNSAPANNAWEYWSDLTWHSISGAWGTNGNLLMLAKICGNLVNVSENLGISKNVIVAPNPTSGIINIAFTLPTEENVTVSVSNTLGQIVSTSNHNGMSNGLVTLDIANQPNGVYFVTINNGKDKMVQRLILNK